MKDLRDEDARAASSPPASRAPLAEPGAIEPSDPEPAARATQVRDFLMGIPLALVGGPLLFRLRFGVVDEFGWGFSLFIAVLCALGALGVWAQRKPALHTPVQPQGGLGDKIGGLWLLACAVGPLASWIFGQTRTLTDDTWRVVLGVQFALTAGLPLVTMVPNLRYARGGSRWIALAILFGVTLLPVAASYNHWRDLRDGPVERPCADGTPCRVLPHSGRLIR
jgi:hypothetical protein